MSNYLVHYASKYYDPIKAHEYYEEHKQLKGRKSTASLNEEGKYAAEYLKTQINALRDKEIADEKSSKETRIESAKNLKDTSIESYTNTANTAINRLQAKLKSMNSAEKARNYEAITNQIAKLRANNQSVKAKLQERFNSSKESINSDYSSNVDSLKTKYENLYLDELDKLKEEKQYQKKTKTATKKISNNTSKKLPNADIDAYRTEHREKVGVKYKR